MHSELRREIRVGLWIWSELDQLSKTLVMQAELVRYRAYAPYSHYKVGVALVSAAGRIYSGCNVERATYTQTTHAEQNAIDAMVAAEGATGRINMLAIIGGPENVKMGFPLILKPGASLDWPDINPSCGHCLQCILEHSRDPKETKLIQPFANGLVAITTLHHALPMRFGPQNLGITG